MASDGKWYPPSAPAAPPPPPAPAPQGYYPVAQPYYVPQPTKTSGLAIASMVLGILWVYWIGSILAVVFGHIALSQTSRDRSLGGRGMAIAGVVLGWIGVATLILVIIVAVSVDTSNY